jgi:hypothetical protein
MPHFVLVLGARPRCGQRVLGKILSGEDAVTKDPNGNLPYVEIFLAWSQAAWLPLGQKYYQAG